MFESDYALSTLRDHEYRSNTVRNLHCSIVYGPDNPDIETFCHPFDLRTLG